MKKILLLMLFVGNIQAANLNNNIKMALGLPQNNAQLSGLVTVNGWATSPLGISSVELQIDQEFVTFIPVGERRTDVNDIYPSYPDSLNSGFAVRYNFSILSEGSHRVDIVASDPTGDFNFITANITVTKYDKGWASANEVELGQVTSVAADESVTLRNVKFKGKNHDLILKWDQTIQNLAVKEVNPKDSGSSIPLP